MRRVLNCQLRGTASYIQVEQGMSSSRCMGVRSPRDTIAEEEARSKQKVKFEMVWLATWELLRY